MVGDLEMEDRVLSVCRSVRAVVRTASQAGGEESVELC